MYLGLFSCMLLFQSCFEIIEQVFIKNDGSGNFQLVINMSKSKTRLNSMMKMKTVNGHDVPSKEEITQKIADLEKTITITPGISNVKTRLDFNNYIVTLSCNFAKVGCLNAAVKNIGDKENSLYTARCITLYRRIVHPSSTASLQLAHRSNGFRLSRTALVSILLFRKVSPGVEAGLLASCPPLDFIYFVY